MKAQRSGRPHRRFRRKPRGRADQFMIFSGSRWWAVKSPTWGEIKDLQRVRVEIASLSANEDFSRTRTQHYPVAGIALDLTARYGPASLTVHPSRLDAVEIEARRPAGSQWIGTAHRSYGSIDGV